MAQITSKKMPVVNCLFNADSAWKIMVSLSSGSDSTGTVYVDNASVHISAEGFSEPLLHTGNGIYRSLNNTKPLKAVRYTLEVLVPSFEAVTAWDSIPSEIQTGRTSFDTALITLTPYLFSDPKKTYPASVNLTDIDRSPKYYLLRPLYYDKEELKIFKITQETLDTLSKLKQFYSQTDSSKLVTIRDNEYYGITSFEAALNQLGTTKPNSLFKYAYFATYDTYYPQRFRNQRAYVNDVFFRQLADDYYSAFGEKAAGKTLDNYKLSLFYNYIPGESYAIENGQIVLPDVEWYLEVNTLSEAAYRYYTTYLQNIANRNNPFAEPVNVSSNVKNGLGIFAGMHTTRVRVH